MKKIRHKATKAIAITAMTTLLGCSSYSAKPTSTVLPTSNKTIDVVLHRGDVRLMDCATLAVLQTYAEDGKLIDSKEARGTALHCTVIPALIDAGGRVGAAAATRPAINTIRNTVNSAVNQSQVQGQNQTAEGGQGGSSASTSTSTSTSIATATGGNGGAGGNGGSQGGNGGNGNNGQGNGSGDGTNPGTDHHHDNGDGN